MSAVEAPPASSESILRFLRVTLHVGFAVLLAVAIIRMLVSDLQSPARYVSLVLSLALAAVYLLGTVAEKRFSMGAVIKNPTRYAYLWLGLVTALWVILMASSVEFSWLAFPLFFLYLHLSPRWAALIAVVLMTALVIVAQWKAGENPTPPLPVIVGPLFGAAFAVVTSQAYTMLYRDGRAQKMAADELRRTRVELSETQHEAGVLAERARLAREIHDTLAQGFSSLILVSRAASKSVTDGNLESAQRSITMIEATASENLAEARNFVRGLSSPALLSSSLADSLRRLCAKTQAEATAQGESLNCTFRVDGTPIDLPQPYQVTLHRAAQASLANVWSHAGASTAVVSLAFLETGVTLDVYDDGKGFVPSQTSTAAGSEGGFGLTSLAQRVAAQNGTLDIESAPGEGTVVAIRLPLRQGDTRGEVKVQ